MSAYFGKLVNFEPFLLPFMIGTVVAYWRWAEGARDAWLGASFTFATLGALIDWPILLVLLVLVTDALRRWRRQSGRRFLVAAFVGLGLGFAVAAGVAVWTSGAVGLGELRRASTYRLTLHGRYQWWQLAGKIFDYNRRYFTEPVLAGSALVAGIIVRDAWRGRRVSARLRLLALFGAAGALPVVAFPSSARFHPYWQFYLLPYAILALAHTLDLLSGRLVPTRRWLLTATVVCWLVVDATLMLSLRYARPSGYVVRKVQQFQHYL